MGKKPIWSGSEGEVSDLKKWLKTQKFQTTCNRKNSSTKSGGYWSPRGLGSHLFEQNITSIGPKWAETEVKKPWTKAQTNPENFQKNPCKKSRSQFLTCFQQRSQFLGWKVRPEGPGHRFWAKKCDLHFWHSWRQVSKKIVVSAMADVSHLRNRSENTRKSEFLFF